MARMAFLVEEVDAGIGFRVIYLAIDRFGPIQVYGYYGPCLGVKGSYIRSRAPFDLPLAGKAGGAMQPFAQTTIGPATGGRGFSFDLTNMLVKFELKGGVIGGYAPVSFEVFASDGATSLYSFKDLNVEIGGFAMGNVSFLNTLSRLPWDSRLSRFGVPGKEIASRMRFDR
jgi:hypothetical protein